MHLGIESSALSIVSVHFKEQSLLLTRTDIERFSFIKNATKKLHIFITVI